MRWRRRRLRKQRKSPTRAKLLAWLALTPAERHERRAAALRKFFMGLEVDEDWYNALIPSRAQ